MAHERNARATHLLLVRHGQSQFNAEGRDTRWASSALTACGRREAAQAGERLIDLGVLPNLIVSSDLRRAAVTATGLASALDRVGVGIEPWSSLRQIDFGALAGVPRVKVSPQSAMRLEATMEDADTFGAWLRKAFRGRILPWLERGLTVLAVARSRVMQELTKSCIARIADSKLQPRNGRPWILLREEAQLNGHRKADNSRGPAEAS